MWQKSFTNSESPPLWLDDEQLREPEREQLLSKLSYQVKLLSVQGECFGLKLGQRRIQPDRGDQHCRRCLQYLAEAG